MSATPSVSPQRSLLDSLGETANHRNALLLVQLRWLAVFGQSFTIVFCTLLFDLQLQLSPMFATIGFLVLLNLVSMLRPRLAGEVRNGEVMAELIVDISALTVLLYFSGGAGNPFVFLYLLQVTLGAILLEAWSSWTLVAYACLCFALLTVYRVPLSLADGDPQRLFNLHIEGMLVCFIMDIVLLVLFIRQIGANLRRRDERLAELRQSAAEEEHIIRMGLLASGAAHELGTPLATLSVILGDWRHLPEFSEDPERREELQELQSQLKRIKGIVGGILLSAGEARSETAELTTVARSLDELIGEWRGLWPSVNLDYEIEEPLDAEAFRRTPIVSESALRQAIFNVLDNAREASPSWIGLSVFCWRGELRLTVRDRGPGFPAAMLERIGKPYQSSKTRPGSGLGLFLAVNVLRKLGGSLRARNTGANEGGGAEVSLALPLSALVIGGEEGGA